MKFYKIFILSLCLLFIHLDTKAQSGSGYISCQDRYNTCLIQQRENPLLYPVGTCENLLNECRECEQGISNNLNCNSLYPPRDPCFDEKPYVLPFGERQGRESWKAREWEVNVKTDEVYSVINGINNRILRYFPSPFYLNEYPQYPNNPSLARLNLDIAQKPDNLDGHSEDGWLLLYKEIGTSTTGHERPLFVFYNKNKAIMRVFWLLGTRPETYNKVQVELGYNGVTYRSNLLSAYQMPLPALEKGMKSDATLKVANMYINQNYSPYWTYAEFPMIYDPCGCEYETGHIYLTLKGIKTYDINLTIKSQPYSSPSQNATPKAENGFMDFFTEASKVYKVTTGLAGTIGELNGGIKKTFGESVSLLTNAQSDLNTFGSWLNLIPQVGGVVNSFISIVDYFSGGGNQKKQATAPTQIVIMNDLVGTGTMTTELPLWQTSIQTPGAKHISTTSNMPYYDNPLGIMNIVNTPKVQWTVGSPNIATYKVKISNDIKFVVNPYLNIDLSKSEIKMSLEVDIKGDYFSDMNHTLYSNGPYVGTNMDRVGRTTNGRYLLSSAYNPINCDVKQKEWYIAYTNLPPPYSSDPYVIKNRADPKLSLKIVARLKKYGSNDPATDIVYIAKYAVEEEYIVVNYFTNPPLSSYPITAFYTTNPPLEFGDNPDIDNINLQVSNALPPSISVIEKISINHLVYGNHDWKSGNSIELNPGAEISSQNLHWRHCWEDLFWWNWYSPDWVWVCNDHYMYQEANVLLSIDTILQGSCYPAQLPVQLTKEEIRAFCKNQAGSPYYATHYSRPLPTEEAAAEGKVSENKLYIYPNPASDMVTFAYELEKITQSKVYVTDMMGNKIAEYTQFTTKEEGKYEVVANVSTWANGIYLVILETNGEKIVKKLVVNK
ncbi:MAG: T9SS C-terminal target domain-containing protein [Bacteroidetes bacterium]|nr:MAG: T9SS C-terminal target domain-containing protein [Bacteroidota bacterium]TAG88269.1 MAG: T9SS C-terminal target domain-containing protein [Bacteroidota bacterium]